MEFRDRTDAGKRLADVLKRYAGDPNAIVLALPRGGVPVGYEIARELHLPLDVFIVRKLGVPGQEELAMGAIASGGIKVLNESIVEALGIPHWVIEEVAERERVELARRERQYRGTERALSLEGKTAILVDDGLATGSTMKAAILAVDQMGPAKVVVAVPVSALSTCREIGAMVDDIICLKTPVDFRSVGGWYQDFQQTTDREVQELLSVRLQP
jgi:predicted phosphoribosyltransferase